MKSILFIFALIALISLTAAAVKLPDPGGDEGWLELQQCCDKDHDGTVSFEEFTHDRKADFRALRLFVDIDRNNDKRLSREDFSAPPASAL